MEHRRTFPGLTRRQFLGVTAVAAGAATVGGFGFLAACEGPPPGTNPARNALKLPQSLVGSSNPTLTATQAVVDFGGGQTGAALTYDGAMPGPTLHLVKGGQAQFTLVNGLAEPTTIHSHGMIAPTGADGQPIHPVAPGASFQYTYPVVQRAGLNFYHPHPHGLTGKQVNLGLAGAIIVHDDEEDALDLPAVFHDVPLIVRDAKRSSSGDLEYRAQHSGFSGDVALVNGTIDAALGVDTALYRFRLLNGSNARVVRLALSDGSPFTLIGNDGGLLPAAAQVSELLMAPAERCDVLVDLRGLAVGERLTLQDLAAGWDILELEATRAVNDTLAVPTGALSSIEPLGPPVRTREFSFDGMSKINGATYDMSRIDFTVPFGETERWRFTTGGNAPHPVHVHGVPFQVESRTGGRGRLEPWEVGWKDTVLLEDGETVDILINFAHYRGQYLLHCHQLEHEDNGMMAAFEVV